MSRSVLIFGATSAIAEAVARLYAAEGARLYLVARREEKLRVIASDLTARGASEVRFAVMDANALERLASVVDEAWDAFSSFDIGLVAHGTLPDQNLAETDTAYVIAEFRTNAESVIACLAVLANRFEKQGRGVLAVIGSVAGDRGRSSNYLYGAAKAAIHAYASGLRARLLRRGVHVLTIKPGFVATPMTAHLNLPQNITARSGDVARDIKLAIEKRRDVLYTPWFWRWIMAVIRTIPEAAFKRTSI
jgi:short-subunit dehydrogenase